MPVLTALPGQLGQSHGEGGHVRAAAAEHQRDEQVVPHPQELEDAERLSHNLHGVAGSFGAARLKEASKALELALVHAQTQSPDEIPSELAGLTQSFEVALTEVLESAEALATEEVPLRAADRG